MMAASMSLPGPAATTLPDSGIISHRNQVSDNAQYRPGTEYRKRQVRARKRPGDDNRDYWKEAGELLNDWKAFDNFLDAIGRWTGRQCR